ncbi:MBL fold metallo-hydrolase [Chitinophaga sp. Cy-1792]|uniref:MBL fold metallo-hydrolase n=1 Tax=Chitinophaga sp. Cy-1792 TaxID=2608339 RepID=UPI00141D7EBD|nr:MBL fold metallo-hydrolase [Chitinophaga sp. Cy-1792]NIG56167.1 MBL fold metallo-hydrolase [Chitinophaga sp. Cy-1792]
METSSHFNGKQFVNTLPTMVGSDNMTHTLWRFMTEKGQRIPPKPLGPFTISPKALSPIPSRELQYTWLGHSSYLLEMEGIRILVDPVFTHRASPFSWMGPVRFFKSPVSKEELPPLTAVVLTHNHWDHLDRHMMKYLGPRVPRFICPLGVDKHLKAWGIPEEKITVLDWGGVTNLADGITLTSTPARHFSGRWLRRDRTLWTSYVLKGNRYNVFIGGDSGFFPGFADIGNTYGPFDLTILEIGAYDAAWPDIHMGPAKAIEAHQALKGRIMLPVHWGTFNLALHPWDEPAERILPLAKEHNVTLWMPEPGATATLPDKETISYWWRKYQ